MHAVYQCGARARVVVTRMELLEREHAPATLRSLRSRLATLRSEHMHADSDKGDQVKNDDEFVSPSRSCATRRALPLAMVLGVRLGGPELLFQPHAFRSPAPHSRKPHRTHIARAHGVHQPKNVSNVSWHSQQLSCLCASSMFLR